MAHQASLETMDPPITENSEEWRMEINAFWIGFSTMLTSTCFFLVNIRAIYSYLMITLYGISIAIFLKFSGTPSMYTNFIWTYTRVLILFPMLLYISERDSRNQFMLNDKINRLLYE
jgi:hypothetical protein